MAAGSGHMDAAARHDLESIGLLTSLHALHEVGIPTAQNLEQGRRGLGRRVPRDDVSGIRDDVLGDTLGRGPGTHRLRDVAGAIFAATHETDRDRCAVRRLGCDERRGCPPHIEERRLRHSREGLRGSLDGRRRDGRRLRHERRQAARWNERERGRREPEKEAGHGRERSGVPRGIDDDDPARAVRMPPHELLRDIATERMADEHELGDARLVDQRGKVIERVFGREARARSEGGPPVRAKIPLEDPCTSGPERRGLFVEHGVVEPRAVDERDGRGAPT